MILDARELKSAIDRATDVVVIGSGPAGIALALALDKAGVDCIVLEAGGLGLDKGAQDFYRASSISPEDHGPVHLYRRRAFGGTSAIWGGRCIPFDPIDFEDRDWIPNSEWPITYEQAARYYPSALELCRAGPELFHAAKALPRSSGADLVAGTEDPDVVLDRIERFSEPTHFGRRYRARLASNCRVTVLVNASVVEITVSPAGHATGVLARCPSTGKRIVVRGRRVVVAAGALETARLLLASRSQRVKGLGNDHDLVGRFYQSHLEGEVGEISFKRPAQDVRLDYERSPEGVYCRRYIWLSPAAQRRERLAGLILRPNHATIADPAHGHPILSAMYLAKDMIVPEYGRRMTSAEAAAVLALGGRSAVYRRHLANVVRGSPRLAPFAIDWVRRRNLARRKLPSVVLRDRRNRYPLDLNAEQTPNPESRVLLSGESDALGMPRLSIDWRINEQDRRMVLAGLRVLQGAFARGSGAELLFDPERLTEEIASLTRVGGHHIGTARMASGPHRGVVDPDCQCFDTPGLYLSGSAVFPTSGFANPTLLIVALSLRLADHLAERRH